MPLSESSEFEVSIKSAKAVADALSGSYRVFIILIKSKYKPVSIITTQYIKKGIKISKKVMYLFTLYLLKKFLLLLSIL